MSLTAWKPGTWRATAWKTGAWLGQIDQPQPESLPASGSTRRTPRRETRGPRDDDDFLLIGLLCR